MLIVISEIVTDVRLCQFRVSLYYDYLIDEYCHSIDQGMFMVAV